MNAQFTLRIVSQEFVFVTDSPRCVACDFQICDIFCSLLTRSNKGVSLRSHTKTICSIIQFLRRIFRDLFVYSSNKFVCNKR